LQEFPAYEDLIQGLSGHRLLNAGPDGEPRYFPMVRSQTEPDQPRLDDRHGLFHRERTGEGQEVHVPMLETILSFALVETSLAWRF